jgi:hypothetical protein
MKATLTYTLPDDQAAYDAARLGSEAIATLWDIDQHCRSVIKHGEPTIGERHLAEEVRAMIRDGCPESVK